MTDWSRSQPDRIYVEDAFLESMLDSLNEDCVIEVLKYLKPLQLKNISKRNHRISDIITSRMSRTVSCVKITVESVGTISIMNFHYLLLEYGTEINELHVSITAFPSTFGLYTSEMKYTILFLIMKLAKNLKSLCLTDFNLDSEADDTVRSRMNGEDKDIEDVKSLIDLMKTKGVQIAYKNVVNELKPFNRFLLPQTW